MSQISPCLQIELLNDTMELCIHSLVAQLPITDERMAAIKDSTNTYAAMQRLMKTIQRGWPRYWWDVHPSIRPYWQLWDELQVIDNLVFRGECVVIPQALCHDILEKIHESHLGVDKCKA